MVRIIITLFFLSIILAGCANWQTTTNAWEGRKLDDLILSWGPPESLHELSDGRKTVLFRHSRMNQGTELYCNVTYNTDTDGIITSSTVAEKHQISPSSGDRLKRVYFDYDGNRK